MKRYMPRSLYSWTIIFLLIVAASATALQAYKANNRRQQATAKKNRLRTVPQLRSVVAQMEIVSASIEGNPNDSGAMLVVTVRNNSNQGVTSYRLVSGDFATGSEGGVESDPPKVVVPEHGTDTLTIPIGNMVEGEPLVVSAAVFEDGTEVGTPFARNLIRHERKSFREQYKKKQGEEKQ